MKRSFNSCCVTGCESCSTSATTSVPGCCHIKAMNYDPLATCDDGTTCCYCEGAYVQQLTPTTLTANTAGTLINGGYWTIGTYTINYNFTNCPNFPVGQDLTVTASYNGITYDPGEGAVITFVPCVQTPTITVVDNTTGCTAELVPIPNTYGCMEPSADNYNPTVMCSDGSCVWLGCTDPAANNYDPTATHDDGSCTYTGCMDPGSSNYNPNATTPCVSCCIPCIYGCMDPNATNYYLIPGQPGYDPTVTCPCPSCCVPEVLGCTDPTADNYDPLANTDDGSCIYPILGCTDPTALNYDPTATVDDGSCCYVTGNWTQLGQDIDGELTGDLSGNSVSLSADGSTVAIGAWQNDGNGNMSGHVRVYQNVAGTWSQIGQDIDGEATLDESGYSVSLSADGATVAIGAYLNNGNANLSGHVRVYQNVVGTWTQIGSDIDGEAASDQSGYSVSLSADGATLAIGAPLNSDNGVWSGHVRVYQNVGGTWTQVGQDIDGEAAFDTSGISVSLSADGATLAIGASANDGNGSNSGHVRVYQNVVGTWTQIGQDIDGEATLDESGISVSLSADGSIVAIGARENDGNGSAAGHVRVYQNVVGTWTQIGQDIDGETAGDWSGLSVSLSDDGTTVAIGAPRNGGNGPYSGHVRVYQNVGGTWTQVGVDIDAELAGDLSGESVSLSADGSIVAIGAPHNDGNGSAAGHVRVYQNVANSSCDCRSLIVTLEVKDAFPGQTNGEILATVTGGTAPYTYLWSNGVTGLPIGQTTNPATGLPLGPYTVTVTDANGCTVTDEAFVLINIVYGCTDPLATNYSFIYNTDDGSCIYPLCHIPDSNFRNVLPNFNPLITVNSWRDVNGVPTVGGEYINVNLVNTITTLNIQSQNIADLTGIECFTALTWLNCWGNQLTSLDVSQNTALTYLSCRVNQLTSLNVSGATALTYLGCNANQLTSLNVSQNTALTTLGCAGNQLSSLNVSQNTALINLYCYVNQLTSLDISQNTALTQLQSETNQITSLDVSQNTALTYLALSANQLTSLDVSGATALTYLDCHLNQLTSLDVRNGNNTNFTGFHAHNNPNLYCIDVDNDVYSTANWLQHDPWASFSNDCSATNITNTIWTKFNKL
jgi:hypothetical protein